MFESIKQKASVHVSQTLEALGRVGGSRADATAAGLQEADRQLIEQAETAAALYEDAAMRFRQARLGLPADGITGYDDFLRLADAYEERARQCRAAATVLRGELTAAPTAAPPAAPISREGEGI
eukprot:TRINITY_DN104557_c0_g1_i1.p1 TRINITY_DN104557_c0_g1~~TRINITY_DN104557_c0_g1_i1.p1  ORF type:complete len:124 (-),score=32.23 TRINITY_DN104557_c0_g1_i1:190-561(-)